MRTIVRPTIAALAIAAFGLILAPAASAMTSDPQTPTGASLGHMRVPSQISESTDATTPTSGPLLQKISDDWPRMTKDICIMLLAPAA